jgi:Protein of unknown function (DUF1236)
MRRTLLMTCTALAIAASSQSFAQTAVIELTPEHRTTIREYVVRQKVRPVTITGEVRVGAPLPADVQLVTVPNEWGPEYRRYRYVYWNDRVVLVNPADRQVVHIVD